MIGAASAPGLIAGVAEHDPLVAGALLGGLSPGLRIDALGDVGGWVVRLLLMKILSAWNTSSSSRSRCLDGIADDLAHVDDLVDGLVVPVFRFWSLGMVISPPTTTRLLLANVSQATRLFGSIRRHASRMASEMVSQTLSGWPSPTDSEEKM